MKSPPLLPDTYYHIYNHANGSDNLFQTEENYFYFLKKYREHIQSVAETFAYCLMPNHFHFLIRTRETEELAKVFKISNLQGVKTFQKFQTFGKLISKQFANFFSSYTQSYNKMFDRKGNLFQQNFKRKEVDDEDYLRKLVHYIHYNPVHHGFTNDFRDWRFSSYWSLLSAKSTLLERKKVMGWFDDKKHFEQFHKQGVEERMVLECEF